MREDINKLVALAGKWKDLSHKINGWDTEEYHGKKLYVRCYFAANSDHTSVTFAFKDVPPREFGVAYFSEKRISFHEKIDFEKTYQCALDVYKDVKGRYENKSKQKVDEEKKNSGIEKAT